MTTLEPDRLVHPADSLVTEDRRWAVAGLGAALAGTVAIVGSSLSGAVYDEELHGDSAGIVDRLADQSAYILLMHTGAMLAALLLLVFAAGLRRHLLDATSARSLLPSVASSGLLLVSVALLMGSALTTEFVFGVQDPEMLVPETAVFFGHWIGTVPWVWAGAGVAALALAKAGPAAAPRWLLRTSMVLGVLTTLLAISPAQYMAGMTGPIWLAAAALGLMRAR